MEQYTSEHIQPDRAYPRQIDGLGVPANPSHSSSTLDGSSEIGVLTPALTRVDEEGFGAATYALLIEALPAHRAAAARALGEMGQSSATTYLIAALHDPSVEVRKASVEALRTVGDPSAIGPLNDLLASESGGGVPESLLSQSIYDICRRETKPPAKSMRTIKVPQDGAASATSIDPSAPTDVDSIVVELGAADETDGIDFLEDHSLYQGEHAHESAAQQKVPSPTKVLKQQFGLLSATRVHPARGVRDEPEKERRLRAEIDALRRAEAEQLERIKKA